jgi:hypothetical protein
MADTVFSTRSVLWGVLAPDRCALTAAVPSNNMIWSGPTHSFKDLLLLLLLLKPQLCLMSQLGGVDPDPSSCRALQTSCAYHATYAASWPVQVPAAGHLGSPIHYSAVEQAGAPLAMLSSFLTVCVQPLLPCLLQVLVCNR